MKKYLPILIVLGTFFLVLIALTYIKPGKKDVLDQTIWQVEELNSNSIIQFTTLTIRFHNQKINGSSECNRFKGRYEIKGKTISIQVIERTSEECMKPGIIEQDEAFLHSLGEVESFTFSGDDLILYDLEERELIDLVLMAD